MCAGPMGASTLERRSGWVSQRVGVIDRGHGALSPCVVGVGEGRCCRRRYVDGLLWCGIGPSQEVGDESRRCDPRGRPVAAKVNPGRGTGEWRSRGAQHVVRAPSRCMCSARHRNEDGGHQWARRWAPVLEVVLVEQGGRGSGPWVGGP